MLKYGQVVLGQGMAIGAAATGVFTFGAAALILVTCS